MAKRRAPQRYAAHDLPSFTKGSITNLLAILGVLAAIFAFYYGTKGTLEQHSEDIKKTDTKVDALQSTVSDLKTTTAVAVTKQDQITSQLNAIASQLQLVVAPRK